MPPVEVVLPVRVRYDAGLIGRPYGVCRLVATTVLSVSAVVEMPMLVLVRWVKRRIRSRNIVTF